MIKRIPHFLLMLVLTAGVLAGCGAGAGNSDSAAETGAAQKDAMSGSMDSGTAASTAAEPESAGGAAQDKNLNTADKASEAGGSAQAGSGAGGESGSLAAAGGFSASDTAAGLNQKLIYHANLVMEVENYETAQTEVRNKVQLAGGYILGFTETVSEAEQGGTFTLKIPASGFSSFLDDLEKVQHESLQRKIEGQDVTEEYIDLEARLKAKELLETQYTEFMKKATKASDLVSFASELNKVQEEIEQIKGRMRYIDQNVRYSTVELRLYEPGEGAQNLQNEEGRSLIGRAGDALRGTLDALASVLQWVVIVLAGALPLLVAAALALGAFLWARRRNRRAHKEILQNIQSNAPRPSAPEANDSPVKDRQDDPS